ncbi:MAG: hypothetical protein HEP71_25335 [Roseivirga sp.]|nr:hypothetical protein [Roseivirga sp.]
MSFEVIVYQLLRICRIPVSKNYLFERLKAHPDYPSLASLTDLLDEWELEYSALQLEPSDLDQMEYPFLAHVVTAQGMEDFEIVKSTRQLEQDKERFLNAWTGIVIWIAGEATISSEEHQREVSIERIQKGFLYIIGTLTLALLAYSFVSQFQWTNTLFALLSLAGIVVSATIVAYAMGIDSSISKSFCKVGISGCQKIINSSFSKLLPNVHISDLVLSYFTGLFLIQVLAINNAQEIIFSLFLIPAGLALLASLFTLGYQLLKNDWCKLCLLLTAIIWAQAALIVIMLPSPGEPVISDGILTQSLLIFTLSSGWILIKPFVEKSQKVESQNITIRKWRQNPSWFQALLPLHKAIDKNLWSKEVFYGNPSGALQITLATGPYCHPCSIAHARLDHIYARYPNDIGVKIRFVIKESNPIDREATLAILNTYDKLLWQDKGPLEYIPNPLSGQIIKDWFSKQDLKAFNKRYKPEKEENPDMIKLMRQHIHWGQQFQIEQTPGFFVNGFEMPNPHTLTDLNIFLDSYMELLKAPHSRFEVASQSTQSLS